MSDEERVIRVLILIGVIAGIALISYLLYLGFTKKAVFYLDKKDVLISFSPWIIMLITMFFVGYLDLSKTFYNIGIGVAIISGLFIIYKTGMDNRKLWLALPLGVLKIIISFIYVFSIFGLIFNPKDKNGNYSDRTSSLIFLGLLSLLIYSLINGEEVYEKNGWLE